MLKAILLRNKAIRTAVKDYQRRQKKAAWRRAWADRLKQEWLT